MSASGSFKRRSLKLRRSHRERRDTDADCESAFFNISRDFSHRLGPPLHSAVKRSDSVRSKRKVSSISDRSDTSDMPVEHDVSGEESPGMLSDDQPPESPSDAPEMDEGVATRGMPWLRVSGAGAARFA